MGETQSHHILQLSQLLPRESSNAQIVIILFRLGRDDPKRGALPDEELLMLIQEQSVQHPGGELFV